MGVPISVHVLSATADLHCHLSYLMDEILGAIQSFYRRLAWVFVFSGALALKLCFH